MSGVPTLSAEVRILDVTGRGFWVELGIDLSVASLRDPAAFPLIAETLIHR